MYVFCFYMFAPCEHCLRLYNTVVPENFGGIYKRCSKLKYTDIILLPNIGILL